VDGRLTTLGTVLRDGDALQLLMAPENASGPSTEWLEHARTPAARIAIRQWLDSHPEGSGQQQRTETPAGERNEPSAAAAPATAAPEPAPQFRDWEVPPAIATELPDRPVRLARCCTPVPPDAVTGFAVRGGAITAHRESCSAVTRMTAAGRRAVPVLWKPGAAGCRVTLHAEAFGRPHLLADLTETIAMQGADVVSAAVEPPRQQRVRHTYTLQLPDATRLSDLMRAMRRVPGVYDVIRATRPVV
jgi:guanosine-3',5'-bis(diphosphate) 3'-pyrophosphohydrolase